MIPAFTTLQSCPACGSPMVSHVVPANHDRPGMSFLRCVDCGAEVEHRIAPATPSIASPGQFTNDPWWERQGGPAMTVHAGTRR